MEGRRILADETDLEAETVPSRSRVRWLSASRYGSRTQGRDTLKPSWNKRPFHLVPFAQQRLPTHPQCWSVTQDTQQNGGIEGRGGGT